MKTPYPGPELDPRFGKLIDSAVRLLADRLSTVGTDIQVFSFSSPPLAAGGSRFEPLDYLELGLTEKLERHINFLLIVTEGEMATAKLSFAVAYPSRLTNVGIVSVRRLIPDTWGSDVDDEVASRRLTVLLLHTLGHILNLGHDDDPSNIMHDFVDVSDLDTMDELTSEQRDVLRRNLPIEAHDETSRGASLAFWWRNVSRNLPVIGGTLTRANPLRLMGKLPTMLTAALSVVIVLFFSAEVWDVADAVAVYQIVIFTVIALVVASAVLYQTFGFGALLDRERLVSESTVVTQTATALAVSLTVLTVFTLFFSVVYLAAITIFPRELMAEWASVDPATDPVDHVKLGLFLAGMAVLTGSLGGRGDSKRLVRTILFLDEET